MSAASTRKPFRATLLAAEQLQAIVPDSLIHANLLATADARCLGTVQMIYDAYLVLQ